MSETVKALRTEAGDVFIAVFITGANLSLHTITADNLREVADEMDRLSAVPVLSDSFKIRSALPLLENYDPHEEDCSCDLCMAIAYLNGPSRPKMKETA